MRVPAVDAAPAQVIGQPWSLRPLSQLLDPLQMVAVKRLRIAEVHRDTMLDDAILVKNPVEHRERASAIHHVVFRDDFEPIHDRLLHENVIVMRYSQPDPNAVFGVSIEAIGRHVCSILRGKAGQVVANDPDRLPGLELALLVLGPVGSTGAVALAVLLAPVLLVAAALALAIVLPLTGVLGESRLLVGNQHARNSGRTCSALRVSGNRLGVETSSGAAEKPGESRGQCEVASGIGLHEESLSSVGSGSRLWCWKSRC